MKRAVHPSHLVHISSLTLSTSIVLTASNRFLNLNPNLLQLRPYEPPPNHTSPRTTLPSSKNGSITRRSRPIPIRPVQTYGVCTSPSCGAPAATTTTSILVDSRCSRPSTGCPPSCCPGLTRPWSLRSDGQHCCVSSIMSSLAHFLSLSPHGTLCPSRPGAGSISFLWRRV